MKQGLLQWSPCRPHSLALKPSLFLSLPSQTAAKPTSIPRSTLCSVDDSKLTARERRQLRKEIRESKPAYNWKQEVEERLIKTTKVPRRLFKTRKEEMNLDNLADWGTQWWVLKVSRALYQETVKRVATSLVRNFPDLEFKVYAPSIQVKRKLKSGTISIKPKPIFAGCMFLNCVLNKEVHDCIRECYGVGGFIGFKVGSSIARQINRPRPVANEDMEAVFRRAKEEQEKIDRDYEEEHQKEGVTEPNNVASKEIMATSKTKRQTRKTLKSSLGGFDKSLVLGSSVRITSGSFADFSGSIKKLDRKKGMATVQFTVFGKEILADVQANEIVAETN